MSGKMSSAWFRWVEGRIQQLDNKIDNLEESLASYNKMQKRMLFVMILAVIINGVLLFLK
jgi:hypothetical protein